jgi:hypothetical protein
MRRTYVVSLYDADKSVVVEAVQRDERSRLENLDDLPERIREWERDCQAEEEQRHPAGRDRG